MAPAHDPSITTTAPTSFTTITVRFFAGAAEAAGTEELVVPAVTSQPVDASAGQNQGEPLEELLLRLPDALSASGLTPDDAELTRVCRACSFLINGQRVRRDDAVVRPGDQLDVLPPFAGG